MKTYNIIAPWKLIFPAKLVNNQKRFTLDGETEINTSTYERKIIMNHAEEIIWPELSKEELEYIQDLLAKNIGYYVQHRII